MAIVQLGDLTMNYMDQGSGQPIVFIHGLGESALSWRNQLEHFSKTHRVIAMDLRGHGSSRGGEESISMKQFADDCVALIDALGISRAHFVGLSMGGLVLQEMAKSAQQRMLSLSLCNTAAFVGDGAAGKLPERLAKIDETSMDDMADFIVRTCMPYAYDQSVYDAAFAIFRANRKQPYKAATVATFSVDFRGTLENITVPTHVLTGEFDQSTPVSAAKYIHEHISGSELSILSGVGHLSKLENPQLFNSSVGAFIAKH